MKGLLLGYCSCYWLLYSYSWGPCSLAFAPKCPSIKHNSYYRLLRSSSSSSTEVILSGNEDETVQNWSQIRVGLSQRRLNIPLVINMTQNLYELRHLQEEDVLAATHLIVQEYGSGYPQQQQQQQSNPAWIQTWMDPLSSFMTFMENWMFGFIISVGLHQRIERRKLGQDKTPLEQDHNVLCLFQYNPLSQNKDNNDDAAAAWKMVGMTELSIQPLDPYKTAPPYVIPSQIKVLLSEITQTPNIAYVSNVLVERNNRGKGYSKILMAACESLALSWGYPKVYLHVDADKSGIKAQSLYQKLGYKPVLLPDDHNSFSWMMSSLQKVQTHGLYFVEGIPLLYLTKDLS